MVRDSPGNSKLVRSLKMHGEIGKAHGRDLMFMHGCRALKYLLNSGFSVCLAVREIRHQYYCCGGSTHHSDR